MGAKTALINPILRLLEQFRATPLMTPTEKVVSPLY
jgi:hypothetical protein